jgi:hypothetical protein
MIEIPDRHGMDEAVPRGPIVTSHRFAALRDAQGRAAIHRWLPGVIPINQF